ncbi:MAG: hypothetical protein P8X96_14715 [Desulfobacteraceae bacterium]
MAAIRSSFCAMLAKIVVEIWVRIQGKEYSFNILIHGLDEATDCPLPFQPKEMRSAVGDRMRTMGQKLQRSYYVSKAVVACQS